MMTISLYLHQARKWQDAYLLAFELGEMDNAQRYACKYQATLARLRYLRASMAPPCDLAISL